MQGGLSAAPPYPLQDFKALYKCCIIIIIIIVVGRQNADIADTLQLRDVAMATTFWLSMGYNFGCVIGVKLSEEDIADFEVLRDVAMATIFWLSIYGVHWLHLANTTEPSMCGGNAALCKITLTTCLSV